MARDPITTGPFPIEEVSNYGTPAATMPSVPLEDRLTATVRTFEGYEESC